MSGQDPWGQGHTQNYPTIGQPSGAALGENSPGANPWANWLGTGSGSASPTPQYHTYQHDIDDTDTETASTTGEIDYNDPQFQNMTPHEVDNHLFWTYQRAKSNWRKHMRKPVRKVRKFLKRKGKGRGKGKSRFSFLAEYTDEDLDNVFFGGGTP